MTILTINLNLYFTHDHQTVCNEKTVHSRKFLTNIVDLQWCGSIGTGPHLDIEISVSLDSIGNNVIS